MQTSDGALELFEKLKLTALLLIPLGILISLIYHFKNKAVTNTKASDSELGILEDEMKLLAQAKKAQRIEPVFSDVKPKLDSDEIRNQIESKREEFDELELVSPLIDLQDIESDTSDSNPDKEDNARD